MAERVSKQRWMASIAGKLWVAVVAAALVGWAFSAGVATVHAQDAELQKIEQEAAEPAPAANEAAVPADNAANQPAVPPSPRRNLLTWLYAALGFRYTVIFLAISFTFVALIVMNFLAVRRDRVVPDALVAAFEAHLNEKKYQEAYELARTDDSFLGRVLSAGLAKLQAGYAESIEAMQEMGEEETMKLEQRVSYIALIGTISPMFGLLGTVDGMVASFGVIAESVTQPKPSELASGIEMALVTTLVGLWLAIPAIGIYHFLKNRVSRLVLEAGILSEGLMSRFKAGK